MKRYYAIIEEIHEHGPWCGNRCTALYKAAEVDALVSELRQEREGLRELIHWALGERDDFPSRPENWNDLKYKPWYWWRNELRNRFEAIDRALEGG